MPSKIDINTKDDEISHTRDTIFVKLYQYVGKPSSMERYINELTPELSRRMPNARFIYWTGSRPVSALTTDGHIDCNYYGSSRVAKMFHMAILELRLARAIRNELAKGRRVALFETQWLASPFFCELTLTSVHDMIPSQSKGLKGWYYRYVLPWILKRKHICISVSRYTQSIIQRDDIQSKVIYNWVSPQLVKFGGGREKLHSASPFLFIGTSAAHKNLERIFLAYLATDINRPLLCIVPSWDVPRLKERVALLGISAKVSFESELGDERVAGLYKSAIALISPSRLEGFGMPLIEAMAFGCPVICSDIPIYREVAADAAIFFNADSTTSLLNALSEIEKESVRRDYQHRGSVRKDSFSSEFAVEGYRRHLQQILDKQSYS